MNTVMMKSLAKHKYGKRNLVAGDTFEAHPSDVKLLKTLGRAMVADQEGGAPQAATTKRAAAKKSGYNRRDMRARS
jgi:hypothetical protein